MKRPRYTIYDTFHRCWLLRVELPTGEADCVFTLWTKRQAEAQRFPGMKSARRKVRQLDRGVDCVIHNERGEIKR